MRRKQFTAVMLSMILAVAACLPMNSSGVLAAENAEAGTTGILAPSEPGESEDVPETAAEEAGPDDRTGSEEAQAADPSEDTQPADEEEGAAAEESAAEENAVNEGAAEGAAEGTAEGSSEGTAEGSAEGTAEGTAAEEEDPQDEEKDEGNGPAETEEANGTDGEESEFPEAAESVIDEPAEQETEIEEAVPEEESVIEEAVTEEVQREAEAYGSDDYPYKNKSYGTYTSADVDPWNFYYREATSFCAWRLNNSNGISFNNKYLGKSFGNASQWYDAAVSAGITVNKTPALGAVAVWKANINGAGQYGHVAWVCGVSGSNVTVEEYNWGTAGKYNKRTITASNPSGYIHFKDMNVCSHKWVADKVQTAPTSTAKGKWLFKCSQCGTTKTIDIPALGNADLEEGSYWIISKLGEGMCVSVSPNQNYEGGNIVLYGFLKTNPAEDQLFTIRKTGSGSYLIQNGNYALDVKDQTFGATVQLKGINGSKTQEWYIEPAGDGWYRLANRFNYYNMDVANGGTADGTDIGTWYNNGNDAQLFTFLRNYELTFGPVEPTIPLVPVEDPLPASSKVTTTNVASGLKVRWEPVPGAKEYVVYRGSTQIKRTSKTEITDTDVKYDNGKKFTHKVAAVSRTGQISTKMRSSTYYRLLPVGITSLKSTAAGRMTVTYDKNGKGSGYVVRFGLKSDMSDAKVITVKDPAATTRTFTGLQEGRTYYVQVRSYKIENGIRYYSGYCTTKTVTIARSASSAQISFSGSQTIAVGTTRRLYVRNAGSAAVSVTKSTDAVRISKDTTSYVVTGNKAGSANVTATAGSVKKSFKITVLSDDQIAQRVYERVKKDCPECRLWGHTRDGKTLVVSMHIKSMGEGAIASDIRVNLQNGSAVIDLEQEYLDEWEIGVPKSFQVW